MNIKPTERLKKRYIGFRIEAESAIQENSIEYSIYKGILDFLGEYGYSLANPKLITYNNSIGIIRCSLSEMDRVKAALTLINKIGNIRVAVHTIRVSGTIKSLRSDILLAKVPASNYL